MLSETDIIMAQEQYQDRLREAERERIAQCARAVRSSWICGMWLALAALGLQLTVWGTALHARSLAAAQVNTTNYLGITRKELRHG